MARTTYLGNPNLIAAGQKHVFTQEEQIEYLKCAKDPIYFMRNYVYIETQDDGMVLFKPRKYQIEWVKLVLNNRFTIARWPRQVGKTTTTVVIMLWLLLFEKSYNMAILADKGATARDILRKIKLSLEELPRFLKQGVLRWNEGDIQLENRSRIKAAGTSRNALRGFSANVIFLDEFAFVQEGLARDFYTSIYPTIAQGKKTKLVIASTPNGMNLFYNLWQGATDPDAKERNSYKAFQVKWDDVPGRDEEWKKETIRNQGLVAWRQEHECVDEKTRVDVISPDGIKMNLTIGTLYKLFLADQNNVVNIDD